jgi:hypothetical protein
MVQGAVPPVFDAWQDLPLGGSVAFQLIGDDDPWNVLASFEALAEEFLHGRLISPALDENIQHMAVLVHGAPEVMPLTVDRQKHLVEVPLVAPPRAPATQLTCKGLARRSGVGRAHGRGFGDIRLTPIIQLCYVCAQAESPGLSLAGVSRCRDHRGARTSEAVDDGFTYASAAAGHERALAGEFGVGGAVHACLSTGTPLGRLTLA